MVEFHDPRRGRLVRLREDNENEIRRYEQWGWQRVDVPTVEAAEAEPTPPTPPAVPRRPAPKKAKK